MPYVEVKVFERRLEDDTFTQRLAQAVTDALCDVMGEEVRDQTWVVIDGVPPKQWGFGGKVAG